MDNQCIYEIKEICNTWIDNKILGCKLTQTKPGSISHLLYGEKPSEQSITPTEKKNETKL